MSYQTFRQRCADCNEEWNAAFGIVGTTIIAEPPKECPKCKSKNLEHVGWDWIQTDGRKFPDNHFELDGATKDGYQWYTNLNDCPKCHGTGQFREGSGHCALDCCDCKIGQILKAQFKGCCQECEESEMNVDQHTTLCIKAQGLLSWLAGYNRPENAAVYDRDVLDVVKAFREAAEVLKEKPSNQ